MLSMLPVERSSMTITSSPWLIISLGQMRTDETGTTRDQNAHEAPKCRIASPVYVNSSSESCLKKSFHGKHLQSVDDENQPGAKTRFLHSVIFSVIWEPPDSAASMFPVP